MATQQKQLENGRISVCTVAALNTQGAQTPKIFERPK